MDTNSISVSEIIQQAQNSLWATNFEVPKTPSLNYQREKDILDTLINGEEVSYDMHVVVHLINGDAIEIKSDGVKSFICREYVGGSIWFYQYKTIEIRTLEEDGTFRTISIPSSSFCWLETYTTPIDWKGRKSIIIKLMQIADQEGKRGKQWIKSLF